MSLPLIISNAPPTQNRSRLNLGLARAIIVATAWSVGHAGVVVELLKEDAVHSSDYEALTPNDRVNNQCSQASSPSVFSLGRDGRQV